MKKGAHPVPATPEQMARFGSVAATLREAMDKQHMIVADLSQALGLKRTSTTPYGWLGARSAPGATYRTKLVKLFGVRPSDLKPRKSTTLTVKKAVLPEAAPATSYVRERAAKTVLAFRVNDDGTAHISLDAVLPIEKALPLFRMLTEAGAVFAQTKE